MTREASAPDQVQHRYRDWRWTLAWELTPEVRTWRLDHRDGRIRFLKVAITGRYPSVEMESARTAWAASYLPVPLVVERGTDASVEWQVTEGLEGTNGIDPAVTGEPERLVRLAAEGLRRFHGAPVGACPFDFRLDFALSNVKRRASAGLIDPRRDFHPEHGHLGVGEALGALERLRPPREDLVVCHGDYCLPNVLIAGWKIAGFLDLGELGVADRWWDLAVATWSVTWNLGPGLESLFLEAYGAKPNEDRQRFFRLLYDMAS